MPKPKAYSIPGFSQYEVQSDTVVDRETKQTIHPQQSTRSFLYVILRNDHATWKTVSFFKILALAYHGQPPTNQKYVAHHWGGAYDPKSVVWLPWRIAYRLRLSPLSTNDRTVIREKYFYNGVTQAELAKEYCVSQKTISNVIADLYQQVRWTT